MKEPTFPIDEAHRWFAVALNNASWDLLENTNRTAEQNYELLHSVHASCHHWRNAGQPINEIRALCLIVNAYVQVGFPKAAVFYSSRMNSLMETHRDQCADWDWAFAADATSRACQLAGIADEADHWRKKADKARNAIAAAEDRQVYDDWIKTNPA